MEFKGTKGKWKLANNDYGYYTSVRNIDDTRKICVSRTNDMLESNANMLLISKAPEMLEMLRKCYEEFLKQAERGMYPDGFMQENGGNGLGEIEQLIKEATEL